jgi:DMSO/TMAO reductase YedYZ molybdopterin-dependent catalytic subunit
VASEHSLEPEGARYGRGVFLVALAGGVSALWWGDSARRVVGRVAGGLPLVPHGWRIYTVSGRMPRFDRATWRLELGGLVERPVSLGYGELLGLPRASQTSDFHCVTGWTVRHVKWTGVRFHDLRALARPRPEAKAVRFVSAEVPYVDSLSLEQVRLADVMLAYGMDGKPLPREHGAPARVVIPEMYGYKNVKWVRRIELTERVEDGYWEQLGYDRDAWVGRSNGYS